MPKMLIEERPEDFHKSPKSNKEYLTKDGREILDATPMAPPIGYVQRPSIIEQIRTMVRSERLAQEARAAGMETPDEADDFEVGDDYDPRSPYEHNFDPPAPLERKPKKPTPAAAADPRSSRKESENADGQSEDEPSEPTPEPTHKETRRGIFRR